MTILRSGCDTITCYEPNLSVAVWQYCELDVLLALSVGVSRMFEAVYLSVYLSLCLFVYPQHNSTRRMAIANETCVSFCNQPKAHFGLPWDAPGTIAVNVTWMEMLVKRIAAYTYSSI